MLCILLLPRWGRAQTPLWAQPDFLHVLQVEASVEPDQTLQVSEQVLERKREDVKAILEAYRFTGILFS